MYYLINSKPERSVLASLRALVPQRRLTPRESFCIAELQANRLLAYFQIKTPAVPDELVSELPRMRVIREQGLPISGSAHWNGRHWIITLSADEPIVRQRFSLMHEFKHVLDHTTKEYLYTGPSYQTATEQAERVADYFAACLLMPKRVVKGLWCQPHQTIEQLAEKLQVSPAALRYRLNHLGLTEQPRRCDQSRHLSLPTSSPLLALAGGRQ
jgi:Zn-dependent peptidase ImmA (M78 family)